MGAAVPGETARVAMTARAARRRIMTTSIRVGVAGIGCVPECMQLLCHRLMACVANDLAAANQSYVAIM
jgi:hypothetical protein